MIRRDASMVVHGFCKKFSEILEVNFNTYFFLRDKLPISNDENAGVFPGKMCSKHRKNHGCGQKKTKSTSSAILGVETAAKSCELKRCADRV